MNSHDRSMVGIDSMILMHAYREKFGTNELKEWHLRAKTLLDKLFKLEILVCISTVTVGEFLAGIVVDEVSKHRESELAAEC